MVFQSVGMDEVTRERRYKTEVSGNTTVLRERPVGSEESQEVRGDRSQECFKEEGGLGRDQGC